MRILICNAGSAPLKCMLFDMPGAAVIAEAANAACRGTQALISTPDSLAKIAVIPANEEIIPAKKVYAHINKT